MMTSYGVLFGYFKVRVYYKPQTEFLGTACVFWIGGAEREQNARTPLGIRAMLPRNASDFNVRCSRVDNFHKTAALEWI